MQGYLDVTKSVIISSPAGSGKTEKLARRYIALLKAGSDVERILAITFTEKAASEMKQRILDILGREDPVVFGGIKAKIPLMRISTIHSFCLKLIKRFSIELGLDPSLSVIDEFTAKTLWTEAIFECLEAEKDKPSVFFNMMKRHGLRGGDSLISLLNELHRQRPRPELLLKEGHPLEAEEEKRILELYMTCLKRYEGKKRERHSLDFDDLELIAYEALSSGPEWHNILYAFDERTDHLLVDEFQDTSTLQWKIIDKLVEEWRAGIGAKRDSAKTPTVFLVGDEKQSIYQFRGANVSVFQEAKQRFSQWLGKEYQFEEVKENFRSLPAIINFANSLFEKLMPRDLLESWRTRYCPFEAVRAGRGDVDLILLEQSGSTKHNRMKEADALAKTIKTLYGTLEVFEGDSKRPCRFSDMVILLRRRTYLSVFENALRKEAIPFIVQKGIGFYDEPEIAILREFVSFIIDPKDKYSLFNLKRSPIRDSVPPQGFVTPLCQLIEDMLTQTGGWSHFWEKQRYANVKKFIAMIEAFEASGLSPLQIREKLLRQRYVSEVSKANVNAEEMNAVRIMTVHAAKGLQFPMVFIPSLDEANTPRTSMIAIDDETDKITLSYEPEALKRKGRPAFERLKQKELEEEKRLFYVAVTRARDYLCMLGILNEKKTTGRLSYINEAFWEGGPMTPVSKGSMTRGSMTLLTEADIDERYKRQGGVLFEEPGIFMAEPSYTEALQYEPLLKWCNVTEDIDIRAKHGDDWVTIGRVMHRVLEELSKGIIPLKGIKQRAGLTLRQEALEPETVAKVIEIIMDDFEKLSKAGYMEGIILPLNNSFSELPFNIRLGKNVFKGRIDRLILKGNEALIYDYKTFPVKDKEMPELLQKYRFQMEVYKEAGQRIFNAKARAYLLFTHLPEIVEI